MEHSKDLSVEAMMLDSRAFNLDKEERPELASETLSFCMKAFYEDTTKRLKNFGFIQFRPGEKGEMVVVPPPPFYNFMSYITSHARSYN